MVFLRLEVKVFPREQVASSPGLFRSLMGNNGDRARDEAAAQKKFTSFLLAVPKPEDVTLGDLASMILDEWHVLRPDQEELVIKKLLDDANPSVDLNVGLTVEEVFVDRGRARADGHDQRGTVRVIQKPTTHYPERLPSVVQDWDSAVQESKRRRSKTKKATIGEQFSPILEEAETMSDTAMRDSPIEERDIPVSSVEAHETAAAGQQEPTSDAIAGTPPFNRLGSEELGSPSPPPHSPSPRERNRRPQSDNWKRKQSPEEDGPVKHPRLDETVTSGHELTESPTAQSPPTAAEIAPPSISNPLRKRTQIPTYVSARHRRPSISQKQSDVVKPGLGLGITSSPSEARTTMLDMPPSETSLGSPVLASHVAPATTRPGQNQEPAAKRVDSSHSAMRKNTPASGSHQRRSVSFANGNGIVQDPQDKAQLTQRGSGSAKPSQSSPAPGSSAPSSSQPVYPPGLEDKISQIKAQLEQEARELESVSSKLKDPKTDPRCLPALKRLSNLLVEIEGCKGTDRSTQKLRKLRKKLPEKRERVRKIEQEVMETGRQSSEDPPAPSSASMIDSSTPVPGSSAPSGLDVTPTWSFGIADKAEFSGRSSAASSNGAHESAGSHRPGPGSSRKSNRASKSKPPVSQSPPRDSPSKTNIVPTPSGVAHTSPSRSSMEVGESKGPGEQREIIEPAPSDNRDLDPRQHATTVRADQQEISSLPPRRDQARTHGSLEDEDEGVIEGRDIQIEKSAKEAAQSLVGDQAEDQDDNEDVDEDEEDNDDEEKDEMAENDEDEEVDEENEEAQGEEDEEDEDDDGDTDEGEGGLDTTMAENGAKERILSLIDDEAKDQDGNEDEDDDDEEDEDDEDEEDGDKEDDDEEDDKDEDEDEDEEIKEGDKDKNHDKAGEEDQKQAMNGFPWQTNEAEDVNDDGDDGGSGPELNLFPSPSPPREIAKTPAQPRSSRSASGIRATLKGLLLSQKAEQAARQEQPRPAGPQPPQRSEIYEVPSSSDSESDSDSDSDDDSNQENPGDILPNGDSGKLRRPYSLRQ